LSKNAVPYTRTSCSRDASARQYEPATLVSFTFSSQPVLGTCGPAAQIDEIAVAVQRDLVAARADVAHDLLLELVVPAVDRAVAREVLVAVGIPRRRSAGTGGPPLRCAPSPPRCAGSRRA
jgi:hypothetical protein